MATDLSTLIPALQRAVAVPGTFADLFPDTLDSDLLGVLMDAFGEAQLDGLLAGYTVDVDGLVSDDITAAEQALVVLYGETRILANEIRNRKGHKRYEAGSVVFEEDQSAQVLVELLKQASARKREIRDDLRLGQSASLFAMADMYLLRSADYGPGLTEF